MEKLGEEFLYGANCPIALDQEDTNAIERINKMNVAEIMSGSDELDYQFSRLSQVVALKDIDLAIGEESNATELDWWLNEYPTLGSAESELLERNKQAKDLDESNYKDYVNYVSDLGKLDREIMMLEMTVDSFYEEWEPQGTELSEFHIGTVFRSGSGRWLCTDIGSRTLVAIRYTPSAPEKMDGPPYIGVETVFDEHDLGGLTILDAHFVTKN